MLEERGVSVGKEQEESLACGEYKKKKKEETAPTEKNKEVKGHMKSINNDPGG